MKRALGAGAALALAALVAAPAIVRAESPRWGSFELSAGPYRPDVDDEFAASTPYRAVFGSGSSWMLRVGASKALFTFTKMGTLEVGFWTGYFRQSGKSLTESGARSGDKTTFQFIPTSVAVTYRFDYLADRFKVPLAPYGRAGLERYNWWVNDGAGKTVKTGATNGWSVAAGVALLLDIFDPGLARELDNDSGINHTYLFFEARKTRVDDFGSGSSWDLSDTGVSFAGGLLLVF